jgi:hypothetical protein
MLHNSTMHCCTTVPCIAAQRYHALLHNGTMHCCTAIPCIAAQRYHALLHSDTMHCCTAIPCIASGPHNILHSPHPRSDSQTEALKGPSCRHQQQKQTPGCWTSSRGTYLSTAPRHAMQQEHRVQCIVLQCTVLQCTVPQCMAALLMCHMCQCTTLPVPPIKRPPKVRDAHMCHRNARGMANAAGNAGIMMQVWMLRSSP